MTPPVETKEEISFEQGLAMLEKEQLSSNKPLDENPKHIPLSQIKMAHSVFQPRQFEGGTMSNSEDHIRNLELAIENEPTHTLDPITVWWSGKSWRVIDGHHRVLAYSRFKRNKSINNYMIPVVIFKGSLFDALAEATRLNAKDKLPMNKSDKYNRAWKLTVLEKYSKKTIGGVCKVSTTTISRMRTILSEIKAKQPNRYYEIAISLTWEKALTFGKEDRDIDDSWEQKLAKEWAKRLGKAFGSKLAMQPKVAAMALELYSETLVTDLNEYWEGYDPEQHEADDNDAF